jgi:hypothetical protein
MEILCSADLALQRHNATLTRACAAVMMRTLEADTTALDRITAEMRNVRGRS